MAGDEELRRHDCYRFVFQLEVLPSGTTEEWPRITKSCSLRSELFGIKTCWGIRDLLIRGHLAIFTPSVRYNTRAIDFLF